MSNCVITLRSKIEDVVTQTEFCGTIRTDAEKTEVYYRDGESDVKITVSKAGVTIARSGDYTLLLPLREKQTTLGKIGIGGADGEVTVECEKLQYKVGAESLLLLAQYALLFADEKQRTSLRLFVKRVL